MSFSFAGPDEFWRRRRFGQGRFFTRADIERRRPNKVTDLLMGTPDLRTWSDQYNHRRFQLMLNGVPCNVTFWVDGSPVRFGEDVDEYVTARDVTAVEVYRGFEIPPPYGGGNACGAVLIWTR